MRLTSIAALIAPLAALSVIAAPTPETANLAIREKSELAARAVQGAVAGPIANVGREVSPLCDMR